MHPLLDAASSATLDALLAQGCACIEEATAHVRAMLQDQATIPIMDVVTIDAEGNATQVGTKPLFPIISEQEELFLAQLEKLIHWYREFVFFVAEHGLLPQEDHDEEKG